MAAPVKNEAPLGGTKSERMQRLQVGGFGLLTMAMLVALADIVSSRLQETQEGVVPEAAPTVASTEAAPARDPLVEAGVAPQLPATPTPTASSGPEREATQDIPEPATNVPLQ